MPGCAYFEGYLMLSLIKGINLMLPRSLPKPACSTHITGSNQNLMGFYISGLLSFHVLDIELIPPSFFYATHFEEAQVVLFFSCFQHHSFEFHKVMQQNLGSPPSVWFKGDCSSRSRGTLSHVAIIQECDKQ